MLYRAVLLKHSFHCFRSLDVWVWELAYSIVANYGKHVSLLPFGLQMSILCSK